MANDHGSHGSLAERLVFRPPGLAPVFSGLPHRDHFHLVRKEPYGYGYSMILWWKQMKPEPDSPPYA